MYEISFLVLTILQLMVLVYLVRFTIIRRRRGDATWITMAMVLLMGPFATLFVNVLALLTGRYEDLSYGTGLEVWVFGFLIDLIFMLCLCIGLELSAQRSKDLLVPSPLSKVPFNWYLVVLLAFVGVIGSGILRDRQYLGGWEEADLYTRTDMTDEEVTVGGVQRAFLTYVLTPAVIVLFFGTRRSGTWSEATVKLLFLPALLFILQFFGLHGGRGYIINIALLIGCCWLVRRKEITAILIVAVTAVGLVLLSDAIRAYRSTLVAGSGSAFAERFDSLMASTGKSGWKTGTEDWLIRNFSRLDSVQNGGLLAEYCIDSDKYAGLQPYYGCFGAFIPRYIWPDKPVPRSWNNSVLGTPHYIVGWLRGDPYVSYGMSVSSIGFWQFSWIGVILTGLLNGWFIVRFSRLTLRSGPLGLVIYLSVSLQTYCVGIASLDALILSMLKILPFVAGVAFVGVFFKKSKTTLSRLRYGGRRFRKPMMNWVQAESSPEIPS